MKVRPILFVFLLITVVVAACSPASTPTPEPAASDDPVWGKVVASGKIVFGSSMDYPPFEGYDQNYQPTGFDIAVARELGARLGFQVEFLDIPFEGLISSVQVNQVNAVIAAMDVNSERLQSVDFSNIYFTDKTSALIRQGSDIKIAALNDLANHRVGVQRGTSYEQWIKKSLIQPGLMLPQNLFTYEKPEHAVRDLTQNYVDVVVMGSLPAAEYVKAGGVELIGESLNTQAFAIALAKGTPTLRTKVNEALMKMQTDGTLNRLASQYLGVTTGTEPLPTPPASTGTAVPNVCDSMSYVADLTVPDGTYMNPGQNFDKVWRIKNTGTCTWDGSYKFAFVQGNPMGGQPQSINGSVAPGQTYDMSVNMTAPTTPGSHVGQWQMVNGQGLAFGTRIWVHIIVPSPSVPGATAVPPSIEYFTGPQSAVLQNEMIVLSWAFSTQGVVSAKLNRTNPDGSVTALYGGADVTTPGTYEDIAGAPGNYTYSLAVSTEFGGTDVETVVVSVTSP